MLGTTRKGMAGQGLAWRGLAGHGKARFIVTIKVMLKPRPREAQAEEMIKMVFVQKEKKERHAFCGTLRSIRVREDAQKATKKNGQAVTGYKYLDLAVVDENQVDAEGKPVWHNIRVSAPEDNPIVLADPGFETLARCDQLVEAKDFPKVRGKFYISTTEKRDPVTKKVVVENGHVIEYHNKKMSLQDIKSLEIVGNAG